MTPTENALDLLNRGRSIPAETIDAFLAENSFPLVDGHTVTFVYRGAADHVNLRHWVWGLPSVQALRRAGTSDLWFVVMDVPEKSRIEYKLEIIEGGRGRWILDPLNPHQANDPFGSNSVCFGTGYEVPKWTLPSPDTRAGAFDEIIVKSRAFADERRVKVYLPARFRPRRRYPLLVVHDGDDYLRFSSLKTVLDNLIHRLEVQGMVVALLSPRRRLAEYGADPAHADFVADEVLPALEEKYPLQPRPQARCLMGASFGAVAALSTAWRKPGVFGNLLLQSGSFAFSDIGRHHRGPEFDAVVEFMNEFRTNPGRPAERMFVSCGMYESLIYENRSMVPLFQRFAEVRFTESRDGHNWENWRDRLREGLSWLFPGPLWLVYE